MTSLLDLPAVLSTTPEPATGQPCFCVCGLRHGDESGVCTGFLSEPGQRLLFNSLYENGRGVAICSPCWSAMPESKS